MRAQNSQSDGATPAVKKFPGSGKEIPQGSKVTQTTSTNDKGQKVTTTSATRSGSEVPLDVKNKIRQRRGLPPIESGNTSSSSSKTTGTGGGTEGLTSSAGSLQKNKQKAKQIADTANKNAATTGSGATTTVGKINFGGF